MFKTSIFGGSQLLALQFLPVAQISRAVDPVHDKATSNDLKKLVEYINRQSVNNSVFGVHDWSVFFQTIQTNNDNNSNFE